MRSPRHLLGSALILVVVAGGLALALPDDGKGRIAAAPPSSARVNQFDPASRSALPGADRGGPAAPATTPPAEAPAAALAVADSWVRAFLDAPDGISSARWVAQLQPYTTDELLPLLRSVDPVNVPEAQVIGEPRTVSSGAGKAEVDVPTTAVVVRLLLVPTPTGWRVAGFEQAG